MKLLAFLLGSCALAAAGVGAFDLTMEDEYTFADYLRDFPEKSYVDDGERAWRAEIFERRVQEIKRHNTHGRSSYRKGVNRFTDRTDEELRAMLGFKPSRGQLLQKQQQHQQAAGAATAAVATERRSLLRSGATGSVLPDHVDWREAGAVTEPKNQGSCGSCWTFSATEAIESALFLATKQLYNLSEQVYVSCTPNPSHCGGQGGCTGGTQDLLFSYVMEHGFYREEDVPYVSGEGEAPSCPLREEDAAKPLGGIKGYVDVKSNCVQAHLEALNSQPLAISLDASEFHAYHSGIMDFEDCGADLNHAVLMVGYGTDETGMDYWLVRNSWGPEWGEGGYIRLSRSGKCALDTRPQDGVGCEGETRPVVVCGTCGTLSYSSYPVGAYLN